MPEFETFEFQYSTMEEEVFFGESKNYFLDMIPIVVLNREYGKYFPTIIEIS